MSDAKPNAADPKVLIMADYPTAYELRSTLEGQPIHVNDYGSKATGYRYKVILCLPDAKRQRWRDECALNLLKTDGKVVDL